MTTTIFGGQLQPFVGLAIVLIMTAFDGSTYRIQVGHSFLPFLR
jgi:hypothetical protein